MPLPPAPPSTSTTWAALALVLTILGAAYSWFAWRRRGLAAGMRGLAWTLLPVAAWLTGTPQARRRASSRTSSTGPRSWCSPRPSGSGIVVAGVAAALLVVSGLHARRAASAYATRPRVSPAAQGGSRRRRRRAGARPPRRSSAAKRQQRRHRGHGRHRGDPEAARDLSRVTATAAARQQRSRSDAARHAARPPARRRRCRRLDDSATTPMVVVDLDAFDANAADLVRRARRQARPGGVEVAARPGAVQRALAVPGFAGRAGLLPARGALAGARGRHRRRGDGLSQRRPGRAARPARRRGRPGPGHPDGRRPRTPRADRGLPATVAGVRVAIDIDAGLRMGRSHVGPKRSPLHDTSRGRRVRPGRDRPRVLAGRGDDLRGPGGRRTRRRTAPARPVSRRPQAQVGLDRPARGAAGRDRAGPARAWSTWSSGTPAAPGSVESTVADPVVTEVAAGSGLLVPGLFDHYESFDPRPAAFFGVPVVRRPGGGLVDGRRRRVRRQRSRPARTGCRSRGRPRTCT